MKKQYIAPCADVMLLMPEENIASWTQNNSWKMNGFFWSSNDVGLEQPPASGTAYWWEFGMDELGDKTN